MHALLDSELKKNTQTGMGDGSLAMQIVMRMEINASAECLDVHWFATLTQARQVIVAKPPQLPSTFHCGDRVVI
jgi:hypothetical protein